MLTLLLTALVACGGDGVTLKKIGSMACGDCCPSPAAAQRGFPGASGVWTLGMPGAPHGKWLRGGGAFTPARPWTFGWAPEMRGGAWVDGGPRGKRAAKGEGCGEPQVFVLGAGSKGDDEPQVFVFEHDGASGKAAGRKVKVRAHAGCGECCKDDCRGTCEINGGKSGPHTFNLKVPAPGHPGGPGREFEWRGRDDDGKEIEVHVNVVGAGVHGGPHGFKFHHGDGDAGRREQREFKIKLDRDDDGDGEHEIKVFVAPQGGADREERKIRVKVEPRGGGEGDDEKEIKVFVAPEGDKQDGQPRKQQRIRLKRTSDAGGATSDTGATEAAVASAVDEDDAVPAVISLASEDAAAAEDGEMGVVVVPGDEGDEPGEVPVRLRVIGDDKDGEKKVILRKAPDKKKAKDAADKDAADEQDAPAGMPPVWIGVRMAPIPAPLAAHVGGKGLMVANVAKDSPADAAGVKQYDVILAFDGNDVTDNNALVAAVQAAGAGKSSSIDVLRDGKRKELSIKPAKRPGTEVEYKYEDQDAVEDDTVRFRGGTLKPGPGGVYTFEDLGDLKRLPDLLKEHLKDLKIDVPHTFDLKNIPQFQWRMDLDGGDDDDAQVEVRIIKHGDDGALEISRSADGEITVKRADKGGSSTTATYKNMDELREKDEEAARLMGRWSHGGGFMHVVPDMGQLPKLQRQWQSQMQKHLGQARDRIHDARTHVKMRAETDSQSGSHTEIVNVQVDDDGAITIITQEDGKREEHKFGSKKEMKANAPELYEKYREFLEE